MKAKTHLTSGLVSETMVATNVASYQNGSTVVYTNQTTHVTQAAPISLPVPIALVCVPYQLLWAGLVTAL